LVEPFRTHDPAVHVRVPLHALPSAMHWPPTQHAPVEPEQSLFAQHASPAMPQATVPPAEQSMPFTSPPELTHVGVACDVSQQPPFVQTSPVQHGWSAGHVSQVPATVQMPPFEQVEVADTHSPPG
jgi:hypothetical protein